MFQNCVSFQTATQMFYSMQYQQGLQLIDQCISKDSQNSILYSNRALFYSQLGCVQQALADLSLSIELNHLNYIAYFNMFSLLMRIQRFEEAFQNLCCSLSCLYLIRAKTKKNQLDASKAIKYAQNNMEAHVLKGLIHLQNGKYKLALNELDWACQINPYHEIVKNIRTLIFKKMNPGLSQQQNQIQNDSLDQKVRFVRLQSSYTFEEQDKQKQLRDKIIQFNEIYNNLNEYQGTITTKVPKEQQQENQILSEEKQRDYQIEAKIENQKQKNQFNINQYQKDHSTNQNESQNILLLQQPQIDQQIQQLANQNKCIENSNKNNQTKTDDNQVDAQKQSEQNLVQQIANKIIQQSVTIDGQQRTEKQQVQNADLFTPSSRQDNNNHIYSQVLIADDGLATPLRTSIAPEPGQYGTQSDTQSLYDSLNMELNNKQFHSIHDKDNQCQSDKFSQFESMIHSHNEGHCHNQDDHKMNEQNFESFISQNPHIESEQISMISNNLYPIQQNAMLQFSILKLQILDRSADEINQMKNLYCIANYLNTKQGTSSSNFKLRTACQKGMNNGTQWNQTFDPIQIPQKPQCMKLKVYNKKYSSYRDDLIGQMQVEITTHGLVKLPLFNKKGQLSGSLFMNLQLVFPPIQEVDELQEC